VLNKMKVKEPERTASSAPRSTSPSRTSGRAGFLRLDGRVAPRGLRRRRADAPHRRRRDRVGSTAPPCVHREEGQLEVDLGPRLVAMVRNIEASQGCTERNSFSTSGSSMRREARGHSPLALFVIWALAWVLQAIAGAPDRVFRSYMARRRAATRSRASRPGSRVPQCRRGGHRHRRRHAVLDELGISNCADPRSRGRRRRRHGFGAQNLIQGLLQRLLPVARRSGARRRRGRSRGQGRPRRGVTLRYVRLLDFRRARSFRSRNGEDQVRQQPYARLRPRSDRGGNRLRGGHRQGARGHARCRPGAAQRSGMGGKARGGDRSAGVERLADSRYPARRLRVVPPIEQWNVRREFLKRLKKPMTSTHRDSVPAPHINTPKANAASPVGEDGVNAAHAVGERAGPGCRILRRT